MTTPTNKAGGRFLGWFLMLIAMALMLGSIFSDLIRPAVAVPVGAMFLIFAMIVLNASNPSRTADSSRNDDGASS